MIVVTTNDIPGLKIEKVLGLVRGNSVRAIHEGEDLLAWLRNMVGGEVKEYTKLIAQAREQALDRMMEEARSLGANAIVAARFSSSEIASGAAEMLVYGTAVRVEEKQT